MSISKRIQSGRPTYRVHVRDLHGEWYPQKSFGTKAEAQDFEAQLILARKKGVRASTRPSKDFTFTDYFEKWARECRAETSDGWKKSQDQMFRDHIQPVLGGKRLIEVGRADVVALLAQAKAKGLGPQMRIHLYTLLHTVMQAAIEVYEFRESNPVLRKFRPEAPQVARNFLKPDAAHKFLAAVEGSPYGTAFWIGIYCGLRVGELIALRWGSIDLSGASILIREQWVRREKRFGPVKNNKPVRVPMPEDLVTYLRHRRPLDVDPSAFVIPGRDGGQVSYFTLYKHVKRLTREAGVDELTPHELRHTCAELWKRAGAIQADLRQLFNHSSDAVTKTYMHDTPERLTSISGHVRRGKATLTVVH